jgi:hypothetical protein
VPYQYGILTDADAVDLSLPINNVGQQVIYEDLTAYLARVEEDTRAAQAVFIEMDTEEFTESYAIAGGSGKMQRRSEQTAVAAVKTSGIYDVSYPLEDFADGLGWDDIDVAYLTLREFQRQVNNIEDRNRNTIRYEMLKRLFTNTTSTFKDKRLRTPTLTIQPLANGDSVTYPPTPGNEDPATDDHYLVTGYTVANISNTNNPVATAVAELTEHFGDSGMGENIVYFANTDVSAKLQGLTSFHPIDQNFIQASLLADRVTNIPTGLPGVIKGRLDSGAWLSEWLWIPTTYSLIIDLDAPAPLKRRVDPAFTQIPRGLHLAATDDQFPFQESFWRNRYGFGAGNRLNGVVQKFAASGAYSVPSAYA